ncbi:ATP-binding protein [Actimicrobium sp. CCC2.4]|uniref:ATP-binding protein n=1 Tax=Actimicrobium sp. CCC2.4 TaxID=3048606 RepID=UPI002AC9C8C3|nr:ATP-binding protein [Actimicrobium sp. CCC2.4]MEB0135537.1 ATP-binding protein [Actimicrobium sp. CCC2.4]WPX32294.1 ATP-binding protein [Actimicrobium sp. CCC2.4]
MQFHDFDQQPRHQPSIDPAQQDAASALISTNARLEYLIANTPAIIYSSVPTGDFKMTFVSDNARRVLGYEPADMVADPNFWFDHIHPEDIPTIFSSLALLFVEGQRSYEYRFKTSDGIYLWMHDTLRLMRDANNEPLEVVGLLSNITERKKMEEALQKKGDEQQRMIEEMQQMQAKLLQSEKMASIGQLAAGIAHEINNPVGFVNSNLGSLRGYVDTLLVVLEQYDAAVATTTDVRDLKLQLAQIQQEAEVDYLREDAVALVSESLDGLKRVRDIVQSLKDFAHVGESDWQVADLHHGLDSTLMIAANEFKYKASIEKHYGKLPLVMCLASQINQVFMNLIINAAQSITNKGTITIRTGVSDDWVWIEIGDTGKGIAADQINRIFEPFFTTKPIGQGTGLGLSLSYNIVSQHSGRIEVDSQVDLGTRFTVHLPINPPAMA